MQNSVNPMLLSDFDFARYRQIGDDQINSSALTVLQMLDFDYIYPKLQSIIKNNDSAKFDDIRISKKNWDAPTSSLEIWKVVGSTFLTEYFEDQPLDLKGRTRDQRFQYSAEEKIVLQNAATFFCAHMTEATVALALRSLLKQYAAFNSTNVLVYTRLLPKYPHRRILASMQFVMDVMDINAFEPDGCGVRAIQKLRLTHAMIRNRIEMMNSEGAINLEWNEKEWGSPINQQDMLFAIHTFSIEVIQGMISSGVKMTEEQVQNYYYAWHLIGRGLGINSLINPSDYQIGVAIQNRIYSKEFTANNPNATVLGDPLIEFMDEMLPLTNRKGLYGMVKLFNDKKDYEPIFRDILKLDLSSSSIYYVILYKFGIKLIRLIIILKYFLLPRAYKTNFDRDMARMQHRFFNFIIGKVKPWSDNNFRVADGFGVRFAEEDEKKRQSAVATS